MEGQQVSSGHLGPSLRATAERIVARMQKRYGAPPAFLRTSESEFTHLDLDAYRTFRETMERRGYRFLSDFEIVGMTDSPTSPMAPTMIRAMVSPDGATCASRYQARPTISRRVTALLAGLLALRFITEPGRVLQRLTTKNCDDFESELAGTYVVTSSAEEAQAISLPRSIDTKFFPYGTSADELRAAHEARLSAAVQRTGATPTSMTTIEDVFAMETRLQQCKNAHRAASNWVTQKELRAVAGSDTALADAIFKEVQIILAQSSKPPLKLG